MSTSRRLLLTDLEAFPDDGCRYELIDGELFVTTAPHGRHQSAIDRLIIRLGTWNDLTGSGWLFSGVGLVFTADTGVIPDLVWVSRERLAIVWGDDGKLHAAPDLVVEVLSPGGENERRDFETKLALFSRQGVREYWILDWVTRTIWIYRQGTGGLSLAATLGADDQLTSSLLPGFAVVVADLFSFPSIGPSAR